MKRAIETKFKGIRSKLSNTVQNINVTEHNIDIGNLELIFTKEIGLIRNHIQFQYAKPIRYSELTNILWDIRTSSLHMCHFQRYRCGALESSNVSQHINDTGHNINVGNLKLIFIKKIGLHTCHLTYSIFRINYNLLWRRRTSHMCNFQR